MNSAMLGSSTYDNREMFKGAKGGASGTSASGAGVGAVLAGGAAGAMSSSGAGNMERCPLNDTSFYCQLSWTTNVVGMLIYLFFVIIIVVTFLYYAYLYFSYSKGRTSKK